MGHPGTDPAIYEKVVTFASEINMVPLQLHKEQPGYILNSMLVPFLSAAQALWANEVSDPETIDSATSDKTDKMQVIFKEQIPTFYWEVFDPFTKEEAVCADLVEDLSEIAADLQSGMREFEAGRTGNAVFEWKFGLNSHWGNHVVDALRALHAIRIR